MPVVGSTSVEGSLSVEKRWPVEESLLMKGSLSAEENVSVFKVMAPKLFTTLHQPLMMETGFPDRSIFNIFVGNAKRFKGSVVYYAGWKQYLYHSKTRSFQLS